MQGEPVWYTSRSWGESSPLIKTAFNFFNFFTQLLAPSNLQDPLILHYVVFFCDFCLYQNLAY